jgi:hypothetical protein
MIIIFTVKIKKWPKGILTDKSLKFLERILEYHFITTTGYEWNGQGLDGLFKTVDEL